MAVRTRLKVEGVRDLNRLLRRVGGKELQKELGEVHKRVGEIVIRRLGGKATGVGSGRGEAIRPSAATREVLLRVGGSHRSGTGVPVRKRQWGRVQTWPGGQPPSRPDIIGAANDEEKRITDTYLDGVDDIIRRVGLK